jgi:hypothetical protein
LIAIYHLDFINQFLTPVGIEIDNCLTGFCFLVVIAIRFSSQRWPGMKDLLFQWIQYRLVEKINIVIKNPSLHKADAPPILTVPRMRCLVPYRGTVVDNNKPSNLTL